MGIWDTAGQSDFDTIRPLSYPQTDVFLICFAVDSLTSFHNITGKWIPEIAHFCPNVPYILVGLKSDLRGNASGSNCVSNAQATDLARDNDAYGYVECSAFTKDGLRQVFDQAARCGISRKPKPKPHHKTNCPIS